MELNDKIKFREEMKLRLRKFVLERIELCPEIPYSKESGIRTKQPLRTGSSVCANYGAANRARSKVEFFSKASSSSSSKKAKETEKMLNISNNSKTIRLHKESFEIQKIIASARKNTKQKLSVSKSLNQSV